MDTPSKLLCGGGSLLFASIPIIKIMRARVNNYSSIKLCMGALISSSFLSIGTFFVGIGMVAKMLNVNNAKEFTQLVEDKIDKKYDLFGIGVDEKIDSYLNK